MLRTKVTITGKIPITADSNAFVSQTTASMLHKADIINYYLKILQALLDYWRNTSLDDSENAPQLGGNLLKEHLQNSPPDMTPFFLRQFVKGLQFLKITTILLHIRNVTCQHVVNIL